MPQYGTWMSYGGDARIWLAIVLLATAGGVALTGIRLPLPIRLTRPGPLGQFVTILAWILSIAAFLVGLTLYVKQYMHVYALSVHAAAPKDPIAPVTFTAAVALFVAIMIVWRKSLSFWPRAVSAAIGAMVAPMIFELPFDLIVMARTYPSIPPDPAGYRALFFVPLFLIEITTLLFLRVSPLVRVNRVTFFSFALMLGVFGVWALSGFGYPSAPLPIALNITSKILAFATAASLFLPQRSGSAQAVQPDSLEQDQPVSPSLAVHSPEL